MNEEVREDGAALPRPEACDPDRLVAARLGGAEGARLLGLLCGCWNGAAVAAVAREKPSDACRRLPPRCSATARARERGDVDRWPLRLAVAAAREAGVSSDTACAESGGELWCCRRGVRGGVRNDAGVSYALPLLCTTAARCQLCLRPFVQLFRAHCATPP